MMSSVEQNASTTVSSPYGSFAPPSPPSPVAGLPRPPDTYAGTFNISPPAANDVIAPVDAWAPPAPPAPKRGSKKRLAVATGTFLVCGAASAVGFYHMARSWHQIGVDWDKYVNQFCSQNPYVYTGSLTDCVNYWNAKGAAYGASVQQVCNPASPSECVTFDPGAGGGPIGLAIGGEMMGIFLGLGAIAAGVWAGLEGCMIRS